MGAKEAMIWAERELRTLGWLRGKLNDILQGVNWGLDDKVDAVIPFK